MKPNASLHNPDPLYLRSLIAKAGISQRAAARLIGVPERTMRAYLSSPDNTTAQTAPYYIQFCLECLAGTSEVRPSTELRANGDLTCSTLTKS